MQAKLLLSDGTSLDGISYGYNKSVAGEVVFATGMTGYPEALTDPSFKGQILIMTYPLVGNYGIPEKKLWESESIQVSGLIVSNSIDTPSHFQSTMTLAEWFKKENVPLIEIKDTRFLTKKIREKGVMLGKIIIDKDVPFHDPNTENLVAAVSPKTVTILEPAYKVKKQKTIVLLDCGAKNNIIRCFLKRGVRVIRTPWNFDPFVNKQFSFDALFISNGPGDPKMADKTIATVKKAMEKKIPTLGICLGNQILALAAGGDTYKLKYGHRSQNQPCTVEKSDRCYITTQNHGFAIGKIPTGFEPWFINTNDNTIEGIIHKKYPFMSVQFHPEATPGPKDTEWIFDYFLEKIK
ncbi:MAG TPA: glutamine-hydrolyzing carbamoyl-phosphate synthase small subunit [Patescibacteria group bacterium]|nr:glutamine-hydrolyzing carbamoyl-phosphate synthase small subunit [Patescibacteria group bacterium]